MLFSLFVCVILFLNWRAPFGVSPEDNHQKKITPRFRCPVSPTQAVYMKKKNNPAPSHTTKFGDERSEWAACIFETAWFGVSLQFLV